MKIRRAAAPDTEAIASLYVQLERHHGHLAKGNPGHELPDVRWTNYAREGLNDPKKRFYVALRGRDVIAFVELFFDDKTWGRACEVETLVVDEQERDRGVGRALMQRAEETAREEGALGMRVNVNHMNDEGRRFYERSGYHTIALRYGKRL